MAENIVSIIGSIVTAFQELPPTLPFITLLPIIIKSLVKQQSHHEYVVRHREYRSHYDYIVVGAGSAGAVIAARLSENPGTSVLLLECGGSENVVTDIPTLDFYLQRSPVDWQYFTVPQEHSCFELNNRQQPWPRGKLMGGSSAINEMIYVRGNKRDYDRWAAHGAHGWSFVDLFPYFIKAEDNWNYNYVATGWHGIGGPLGVTSPPEPHLITKIFRNSGRYLGYPAGDYNGPVQSKFDVCQTNVRYGDRCSTSRGYLEPIADRENLHIRSQSCVTRILFNANNSAESVLFDTKDEKNLRVFATKEIILSAGAINSPQLLMLSGIGPKAQLYQFGINVVQDLPGVGQNLQEHVASGIPFTIEGDIGVNAIEELLSPGSILEYFATKNNSLTNNLIEGVAFVKTKYAHKWDDWPDCQLLFLPGDFSTDFGLRFKYVMGITDRLYKQVFAPKTGLHSFTIFASPIRPETRGYIKLQSTDPYVPPIMDPKYFSNRKDLAVITTCMQMTLDLVNTPEFQRYNATPFDTLFPGCEHLALYSYHYIECIARTMTLHVYHPTSTCKMGSPVDPMTVVDPQCRVKGVRRLRVVDASVMPYITSGNPNAPIVAMAEKVAHNMKGWRLKPFTPPIQQWMLTHGLPYEPYDEPAQYWPYHN